MLEQFEMYLGNGEQSKVNKRILVTTTNHTYF